MSIAVTIHRETRQVPSGPEIEVPVSATIEVSHDHDFD